MFYAFFGILSILTTVKRKTNKGLGFLFLILLFIVGGLSTERPDYQVYYDFFTFHSLDLGSISEPLYLWLNKIAYSRGMSYQFFFAIQVAFGLLLIYKTCKFFKADVAIVMMLFTIFPFTICVVQIRTMVAYSIVLYSFTVLHRFYILGDKRFVFLYTIFICIAGTIHYSSLFFLICIIPIVFRKQKIWVIILLGIIFGVLLSNVDVLFSIIVSIIGQRKANNWVSSGEKFSIVHTILIFVIRIVIFLGLYLMMHTSERTSFLTTNEYNWKTTNMFLYKQISFLLITILPLELFVQQYDRYTRIYLILMYILYARKNSRMKMTNRFITWNVLFIIMSLVCLYEYSRGASSGHALWNTVFRSVFEHNLILCH